jgi:hypothetical protein
MKADPALAEMPVIMISALDQVAGIARCIEAGAEEARLPPLTWVTGFATTLLLPLAIVLIAHGAVQVPLMHSQAALIFLFFSWVTSSQAILTLVRLRAVASWQVSATMVATLAAIVFMYLFAATRFDAFLYPDGPAAAAWLEAAALPVWAFDGLVAVTMGLVLLSWSYLFAAARGRAPRLPAPWRRLGGQAYTLLLNQLYVDRLAGAGRRPPPRRWNPSLAKTGASLALHLATGVAPFAAVAASQAAALPLRGPLAATVLAAAWLAGSLCVFELTHAAMGAE